MDSQKIKQDDKIHIGANIREVRLSRTMGQTELAGRVQLMGYLFLSGEDGRIRELMDNIKQSLFTEDKEK